MVRVLKWEEAVETAEDVEVADAVEVVMSSCLASFSEYYLA